MRQCPGRQECLPHRVSSIPRRKRQRDGPVARRAPVPRPNRCLLLSLRDPDNRVVRATRACLLTSCHLRLNTHSPVHSPFPQGGPDDLFVWAAPAARGRATCLVSRAHVWCGRRPVCSCRRSNLASCVGELREGVNPSPTEPISRRRNGVYPRPPCCAAAITGSVPIGCALSGTFSYRSLSPLPFAARTRPWRV